MSAASSTPTQPLDMRALRRFCRRSEDLLVHLYWPNRFRYFEENKARLFARGEWLFVATPGHGVLQPARPCVNFLRANAAFSAKYEVAARARGFDHGVVLDRSAFRPLLRTGYECADVRVGHPHGFGVHDPEMFWQFDHPNFRFGALDELRSANVVRLATPNDRSARRVRVDAAFVLGWW